jgi:hypothetical protein
MVLEHLFVGEVMRYCWRNGLPRIEMLKSQVDNSGFDIVLEAHGVMRHIQLKSSHVGAATAGVGINIELAKKPSVCIIWMFFDPETLQFAHFLWFGQQPGEPLGKLVGYNIGMHTKANAQGIKTERANIRRLPKAAFTRLETIDDVVNALFGDPSDTSLDALEAFLLVTERVEGPSLTRRLAQALESPRAAARALRHPW